MTKYTKEETLILRRCKVKDVYSYLKEAILHFTIPEIELAIKMMENRLKFERNPERRDVYSSILIGLKDLRILRYSNKIDGIVESKDLVSLCNDINELENKPNKTDLDRRNLKRLKKILREAQEVDTFENNRYDTEDDETSDYDLNQYYDYEE